jgi:hypothetical protein
VNSYQIQENLSKKVGLFEKKEKSFLRITEAALLMDKKMICVAASNRSLIFLKYASENLREEFRISGFPNFITAMDHHFDVILLFIIFFFNQESHSQYIL